MKIAHYINNLGSGGAEKLLTDILPMMQDQGHEVELIISNRYANVKKYETVFENNSIPLISFDVSFYNPLQIFKLIDYVNKNNFDIIHGHLFPTQYWLAFASFFFKRKIKIVKTEHHVFNERRNYIILKPIEKLAYSRFHSIIAITDEVKKTLGIWINQTKKITMIFNGVNLNQIQKAKEEKLNFEYNNENINLFMAGRFDFATKDQISIVRALTHLPTNYCVYFAGEGPSMDVVKGEVANLKLNDRVFFLGLRTDVYAIMNKVDLNILSTFFEGLSGVALESLASGRPFIGTNVDGVKEIVPDASFLFPKKNPEMLAQKILEITTNESLQKEMIEKALNHVKQFDTSIMVSNYLKLYNSLF